MWRKEACEEQASVGRVPVRSGLCVDVVVRMDRPCGRRVCGGAQRCGRLSRGSVRNGQRCVWSDGGWLRKVRTSRRGVACGGRSRGEGRCRVTCGSVGVLRGAGTQCEGQRAALWCVHNPPSPHYTALPRITLPFPALHFVHVYYKDRVN